MKYDGKVTSLLENWDITRIDNVSGLFNEFKMVVLRTVRGEQILNTKSIITAIKGFRVAVNPSHNKDVFYFTDIVCDNILMMFEGIGEKQLPELFTLLYHYEKTVIDR